MRNIVVAQNPIKNSMKDLSIIIPAAGMGKRMKSYGPKSLIQLSSQQTIMSRQLNIIQRLFPNADIIYVVGFEADKVLKELPQNIRVVENENYKNTNVVRSIGMGLRVAKTNHVLIVYGDLVFNDFVFCGLVSKKSAIVIDQSNNFGETEVGINIVGNQATHFSYGLDTKWCHIVFLTNKELDIFQLIAWERENEKRYGFEVLNYVLELGGRFQIITHTQMQIMDVDTSKDIIKAKEIL